MSHRSRAHLQLPYAGGEVVHLFGQKLHVLSVLLLALQLEGGLLVTQLAQVLLLALDHLPQASVIHSLITAEKLTSKAHCS